MNRKAVGTHDLCGVPARAGIIAHKVIADVLSGTPAATPIPVEDLSALVRAETSGLGRTLNAGRLRALALTSAAKYLNLLRPTSAEFIDSEVTVNRGRMDLLWLMPNGTLFADELKTERFLNEDAAVRQAHRYLLAGRIELGDAFEVVRVISLTQERRSVLVSSDDEARPLRQTNFSIWSLRKPEWSVREVAV